MATPTPTAPDYDPVNSLLADAVELISAAYEEHAARRHEEAARHAMARIASFKLPVEIVRDDSGIATIVRKADR